ncbi:uncharacterized protein LOC114641380 isoform X4 [Erpetoichthys calabaricus]|uniref:uncharacterized protein LOC114641380 isoform X4 n=1 Tax=Erpetoichthys calabaricus TaxID=27687 RepID=UPI0022344AB3|nr:uncharacterized protein LOC114641380 isoform X4 [Erpetoichthys calabaricus]
MDIRLVVILPIFITCVVPRLISPGSPEVIECDLRDINVVIWYRQYPGQPPVALGVYDNNSALPPMMFVDYFNGVFSYSNETATLTFKNVTKSDAATYYCAKKESQRSVFGNGVTLTYEDTYKNQTSNSSSFENVTCANWHQDVTLYKYSTIALAVTLGLVVLVALYLKIKDLIFSPVQKDQQTQENDTQYAALDFETKQKNKKRKNKIMTATSFETEYADIVQRGTRAV